MPGAEHAEAVDADGRAALSVLRALGMPGVAVAVQGGAAGSSSMKERSAAKKRAEKAVCAEVRVWGAAVAWLRCGRRLMVLGRGGACGGAGARFVCGAPRAHAGGRGSQRNCCNHPPAATHRHRLQTTCRHIALTLLLAAPTFTPASLSATACC